MVVRETTKGALEATTLFVRHVLPSASLHRDGGCRQPGRQYTEEHNEPSTGRDTEIALAGFSVMEAQGAGPVRRILLSPPPGAFGVRSVPSQGCEQETTSAETMRRWHEAGCHGRSLPSSRSHSGMRAGDDV